MLKTCDVETAPEPEAPDRVAAPVLDDRAAGPQRTK
jgi:hypothetical protein